MSDGWNSEETQFNKFGIFIVMIPAVVAGMLLWGVIPNQIPVATLFVTVAIFGVIGGVVNILGRGPIAAGALVGVVMALGGFGSIYYWIQVRPDVDKTELGLMFIFGAASGFLLQFILQRILASRDEA